MDREKVTKPTAQIGFIKFVLIPMFETFAKVRNGYPGVPMTELCSCAFVCRRARYVSGPLSGYRMDTQVRNIRQRWTPLGTQPRTQTQPQEFISLSLKLRLNNSCPCPTHTSSTQDAQRNAKQMGPVDVNGSIHTARKQHQRVCVRICAGASYVDDWEETAKNFFTLCTAFLFALTLTCPGGEVHRCVVAGADDVDRCTVLDQHLDHRHVTRATREMQWGGATVVMTRHLPDKHWTSEDHSESHQPFLFSFRADFSHLMVSTPLFRVSGRIHQQRICMVWTMLWKGLYTCDRFPGNQANSEFWSRARLWIRSLTQIALTDPKCPGASWPSLCMNLNTLSEVWGLALRDPALFGTTVCAFWRLLCIILKTKPKAQSTQDAGRDAQRNAMQANKTCWCEWECPNCTKAPSKEKHKSNIKGKTFEFARASRPASCVDWAKLC